MWSKLKKARVIGVKVQAKKTVVDTILLQLQVLQENAKSYKSVHGEERYHKIVNWCTICMQASNNHSLFNSNNLQTYVSCAAVLQSPSLLHLPLT
jgi:hypothetical protein